MRVSNRRRPSATRSYRPSRYFWHAMIEASVPIRRGDAGPPGHAAPAALPPLEDQDDPEGVVVLEAAPDHLPVPRLEDVEGDRGAREQDRLEGEQGEPHDPREPARDHKACFTWAGSRGSRPTPCGIPGSSRFGSSRRPRPPGGT